MNTKKTTKRANYETLTSILAWMNENVENEAWDYAELTTFVAKEIENLDKKAEAAKVRAAKQKEKGDALREEIYRVLDIENFMSIPEIIKALDNADITPQKITPRLTQLIEFNKVEKGEVSVPAATEGGKTRKIAGYRAIV